MTNKHSALSSAYILAQLNTALEASGLDDHKAVSDPLLLFRQLLKEWFLDQDVIGDVADEHAINELLKKQTAIQVQAALRNLFEETVQLSSAHRTLSAWTRRELDQEVRRLQALIESAQSTL